MAKNPAMNVDANKKRTDHNDATAPWHPGEKEKSSAAPFTDYIAAPQSAKS